MNLEFIEIVLIEELIPFEFYIGFVRIKSQSDKDEFIEVVVSFNIDGLPHINCNPNILNSIEEHLEGNILLNKLDSKFKNI